MQPAAPGYLLIADITGYTRFLTGSELEHARGILEQLFSVLLDKLKSPFVLSNIQGDAILAHAHGKGAAPPPAEFAPTADASPHARLFRYASPCMKRGLP